MTHDQGRRMIGMFCALLALGWVIVAQAAAEGWNPWTARWIVLGCVAASPLAALGWRSYASRSTPASDTGAVAAVSAGLGLVAVTMLPAGGAIVILAAGLWAFTGLTALSIRRRRRGQGVWPGEREAAARREDRSGGARR